jgi:hypothetical protein
MNLSYRKKVTKVFYRSVLNGRSQLIMAGDMLTIQNLHGAAQAGQLFN